MKPYSILSLVIFIMVMLPIVRSGAVAVKADDPNDITKVLRGECNDISNVLPEEFSAYMQQLTEKNNIQDCNALFVLTAKAKVMRNESLEDADQKEARNRAYFAAWRFALHMRQHSKDPTVQKWILEEWNKALRKDDEAVPYQIYALSDMLWDREFLTDDFWKLLHQTHREKTITAFCFVLHYRGNDADITQLEQKKRSEIDPELRRIIQNAFNWRKYRLSGDRTNPGPAAAPPRRDMKG